MKQHVLKVCALSLVAMAAGGCVEPAVVEVTTETPQMLGRPIMYGEPPDAPEHDAVVGLHQLWKMRGGYYVSSLPFCSGTLISDVIVLTAGHCLDGTRELAVYVGNNPRADLLDHLYFVSEKRIHPEYDKLRLRNDIALVRLSSAITEVDPVAALPASLALNDGDIGGVLNFAGFGDDETGVHGVKLQADGTLGGFGCSVEGCSSPADPATQISYSNATGPCYGDSGGPAFVYRDGVPYVAGITSYGDADCTVYGVSTRPDAYGQFIADFAAGVAPVKGKKPR